MEFDSFDVAMMRRALQLAANGRGATSPNPMVGAVITHDGRIIGEGWHRHFGSPHAEVNAVRSVSETDRVLLPESTIYVTLEPCSHYGKTPPCADLLVATGFKRVVVGAGDPNPKVAGRGIARIREAGIRVDTGLLAHESYQLNIKFMTAHTLKRPYITLKWAQSADGFMDAVRAPEGPAHRFSTPLTSVLVHKLRSEHDGIAVGAGTFIADSPALTTRNFEGRNPRRILFDHYNAVQAPENWLHITSDEPLKQTMERLYSEEGLTSVLVEGGATVLKNFLDLDLWDEIRVEVTPEILGESGRIPAPTPPGLPAKFEKHGPNSVFLFIRHA